MAPSSREAEFASDSAGPRLISAGFEPTEKLAEAVLRHISQDIVEGRLEPGQHLPELRVCEELGVSRSPVREAIQRLAAEGLVEVVPRRGAFVADLSPSEVGDVFEVRANLEALSARLAADVATESDVDELRAINQECVDAVDENDFSAFFERNDAFHRAIAGITGNAYLQRVRQAAAARTYRPLFLHLSNVDHLRTSVAEHAELVTAIEQRASAQAGRIAQEHLDHAMREAKSLVQKARSQR